MKQAWTIPAAAMAAALMWWPGAAVAADAAPAVATPVAAGEKAPAKAVADAKSEEIIRRHCDRLLTLKSFRVEVVQKTKVTAEDAHIDATLTVKLLLRRPQDMTMGIKSAGMNLQIMTRAGGVTTTYFPVEKKYMERPAPASAAELAKDFAEGPLAMLEELLTDKPYESVMEDVDAVTYMGVEEVEGVKCHRLHFKQNTVDCDAWFEDSPDALIRKIVPDMAAEAKKLAARGGAAKELQMEMSFTYGNWELDPKVADPDFVFAPPAGVAKAEPGQEDDNAVHPLTGKPAPGFKLNTLDDKTFDLAEHKGKDVVILDFWATWCGPCRKALPLVAEAAAAFKDKGVVFCAVNEQEMSKEVKKFLEDEKLTLPIVGMDREGNVGKLYQVEGIPQTVVIGRDGNVLRVHVGYDQGLKTAIVKDIEAALAPAAPAAVPTPPAPAAKKMP